MPHFERDAHLPDGRGPRPVPHAATGPSPGVVDSHVHTIGPELPPPTLVARVTEAACPSAAPRVAVTFVASGIDRAALARRLGTRRTLIPVRGLRGLTRSSLYANRATVPVEIDVRSGAVSLGGRLLAVEAVSEVPLSRRYLLR